MKPVLTLFIMLMFITTSQNVWAQDSKMLGCGLDIKSRQLAKLILESTQQQRQLLVCNKKLAIAANIKAQLMAKANRISHDIDHVTPNELLKKHGVILPFSYQNLGNQVEAVLGGMETPQESFNYFMTSPDHKAHILGENNFYLKQDQIGVGYFSDENTKYEEHWVVYITALRTKNDTFDTKFNFKTEVIVQPTTDLLKTSSISSIDKKPDSLIKSRATKLKISRNQK